MSGDPSYTYGQGPDSRSTHRMLLGMVIVETIGYKERKYRPAWGRIAGLLPFFLLGLWCATAEMYYFKEKYMGGISTTRRADMYLYFPETFLDKISNLFRSKEAIRLRDRQKIIDAADSYGRAAHLRRKGEYFIKIAQAALKRQDYAEFAKYIGTGASLCPTNLEAQRQCADLFFAFGRPIDSYLLLEDSLAFAKQDRDHFRHYLTRCFMLDQDQRILSTAVRYGADPSVAAVIRGDLQLALAQAHFLRGNYAEAGRLVKEHKLDLTAEGYLLNCQILWENGERAAALAQIENALATYPGTQRLLEIKARWLRDSGNLTGAEDCLALMTITNPDNPLPLIQSLYLLLGPANADRRAAVIESVITRYGTQEQALLDLARVGNELADVALTARLMKLAEQRRFSNTVRFTLVHVECLLNAHRPRETIALIDTLYQRAEREQWVTETRIAFEALRTLAYFADGQPEIGSINLQKLMQNQKVPPQLLVSASRKLIAVQRYEEANDVLIQAHLQNETNQAVLMQIVQLKLDHPRISGDVETYLRRLMKNRRPSKPLLELALRRLGADTFLFSENREALLQDLAAQLN